MRKQSSQPARAESSTDLILDAALVRSVLAESIRRCPKSREAIADEMSILTGTDVTLRRLYAFTAESKEDYRFPLELARAFCMATGNFTLLRVIAERAGFHLMDEAESDLLELGRETLRKNSATAKAAHIIRRLRGVDL